MSDIRFNQWLHQSGTGGVSQVASGAVGVGTTNPLADFYVRGDAQITGILTAGHIAMGSSITFGDNDRIYLGDGTDFQLYHASSDNNSYIVESGAGSLVVNASKFHVKNAANNEDVAIFNQTGNNELYFSNTKRFETTNTGAVVTGILTATTFSGSIAASNINSGTVATARLGSGTASSSTFLRGDGSWAATGAGTGEQFVKLKNSSGALNDGGENVYAGYRAGASLASGANENTFYGTDAGRDCATGDYNVFIGHRAGENSLNSKNTAIGAESLHSQTSGQLNTAVGYQAGIKITTANYNTAVGHMTLSGDGSSHNVTGGSNVVMGYMSGYGISSGEKNVLIGYESGYDMTTGYWNSGLGHQALENVGVGTCNTALGYRAGHTINNGSNNICIGNQVTATASDTSNEVTIGNSDVTKFRIPGINFVLKDNGGTPSSGQVLTADGSGEGYWAASSGTTINSNADNRIITGSGTAGTLNGESNFTYDGNQVAVYAQTDDTDCILHLVGKTPNGGVGQAGRTAIIAESTATNNGSSSMHLRTRNSSNAQIIAMTLDSNQNVGIGTELPGNKLQIGKTGHTGYALATISGTYGTVLQVGEGTTPTTAAALWVRNLNNGGTPTTLFRVDGNANIQLGGQAKLSHKTTTEVNALSAVEGSILYDTTLNKGKIYNGSNWLTFGGGSPVWVTTAGNIGTLYNNSLSNGSWSISSLQSNSDSGNVTYSVSSGSLPTGMSLSTAGAFSGTVNGVGSDTTYTFTVSASNDSGTSTRQFNIIVKAQVTSNYSYTGSTVTWSRPSTNVKYVAFQIWGGAGTHGTCTSNSQHPGAGGQTVGTINVSSHSSLSLQVGEAGKDTGTGSGGWPNGGSGNIQHSCKGAGGGGSSNIYNSSGTGSYSNLIAVAGAGGGVSHGNPNSNGGDGGGTNGASSNRGGGGGTQNAGGAQGSTACGNTGNAGAGTQMQGGSAGGGSGCTNAGAGGGGGWYGGGAGGNSNSGNTYGGGGGGSGYYDTNLVSSGATRSYGESGWSANKPSGIAERASYGDNNRGGHGYIILSY